MLDAVQYGLATLSGGLVGFSLGLMGGGGSMLAVPLMVYLVGVASPHVAIGTSALAVAASAGLDLAAMPARATVNWRCGRNVRRRWRRRRLRGLEPGQGFDGQKLLFAVRPRDGRRSAS